MDEENAEIVMSLGDFEGVGSAVDGNGIFALSFVEAILAEKHGRSVVVGAGELRREVNGGDVMDQGFIEQAPFDVGGTEVVFGNDVVGSDLKRVGEEREAVVPVADLNVRTGGV